MNKQVQNITQRFNTEFGSQPSVYFAPGRINVIGEHLDYNGGKVLPAAMQMGVYVAIQTKKKGGTHIVAESFQESMRFVWGEYEPYTTGNWRNYVLGVLKYIEPYFPRQLDFDMMIDADIPIGAGLSSSAALEVGIAFALNKYFNLNLDLTTLAKIAHQAENQFVGMECGIMDQFTSAFGKQNHLLLLDCQSEKHEYIPAALPGFEWVLIDSQIKHALAESGYNIRRQESTSALEKLQDQDSSLTSLADVNDLDRFDLTSLTDNEKKRAKYVVEECARVDEVVKLMADGDAEGIGQILLKAHKSMKNDYDITCPEVDAIVEEISKLDFVCGGRMMGGGFGGSVIALIKEGYSNQIAPSILNRFIVDFDFTPNCIEVEISDGPKEVK